jgi:Ca2+-binding RTX toxin-like protein
MSQGAVADGNDVLDCGEEASDDDDGDVVNYSARTAQVIATVGGTGGVGAEADVINANCEGLVGGTSHDKLVGDGGNNTLSGGPGNDALVGLDGDDVLSGGDGNDTFVESYLSAGVAVNSTTGLITYTAGAANVNVNDADNGADVFNGNAGTDLLDYSMRTGDLAVTMDGKTADDGISGEEDNTKADIENIVGGSGNDEITGNLLSNVITGGAGDDVLSGDKGDDIFREGAADSGGDTFNGGDGVDLVDYSARILTDGTNDLTITMGDELANDGDATANEGDNFGLDVENVIGGSGADNITGNDLANNINGGPGADDLDGGDGNDRVDGGDSTAANNLICGEGTDIGINNNAGTRATDCEV